MSNSPSPVTVLSNGVGKSTGRVTILHTGKSDEMEAIFFERPLQLFTDSPPMDRELCRKTIRRINGHWRFEPNDMSFDTDENSFTIEHAASAQGGGLIIESVYDGTFVDKVHLTSAVFDILARGSPAHHALTVTQLFANGEFRQSEFYRVKNSQLGFIVTQQTTYDGVCYWLNRTQVTDNIDREIQRAHDKIRKNKKTHILNHGIDPETGVPCVFYRSH